jgi:hypothetical protein
MSLLCGLRYKRGINPKGGKKMTRTNIISSIAAVAVLTATASPAFAAKTQDAQAEAGAAASKGERKVCKILETTGTKMVETVCLTEAGWKEYTARYY